MDRLLNIVTWIQILGGIVFFTALFVSPLALSIKILAAIALMFISCAVFVLMMLLAAIEGLRRQSEGPVQDAEALTSALLFRLSQSGGPGAKRGGRLGYLILATFAVWIVFGLLLRTFFQV
jgi:hypothetical protein